VALRFGLEGRTVVLTGAAGGIGRGLATAFAAQGANLVLVDREPQALTSLQRALTTATQDATKITSLCCNLSDDAQVQTLADTLASRSVRVHTLLNNAGTEYPTPLTDSAANTMQRWAQLLDNNVTSMTRLTRALLPLMDIGASVINQASIWGKTGVADFSAYVASKHAVVGLTRALAWELGTRGIRVNAVCPGWIRTDAAMASLRSMAQTQGRSEAEVERDILSGQAMPGMLTAEDIAEVYLFLASDGARSLTGQSLVASRGEVMA
jgi:NAD(P)-dependent dehydrogenase (short-subunit alcohol dehydrogenase family)